MNTRIVRVAVLSFFGFSDNILKLPQAFGIQQIPLCFAWTSPQEKAVWKTYLDDPIFVPEESGVDILIFLFGIWIASDWTRFLFMV